MGSLYDWSRKMVASKRERADYLRAKLETEKHGWPNTKAEIAADRHELTEIERDIRQVETLHADGNLAWPED
jgi:transcription elongation GreA/GreB family factor